MKRIILCLAITPLLGACATDSYGNSDRGTRTSVGMVLGAGIGALASHAIGLDPVSGAAVGMVAGGAAGYLVKGPVVDGRQYYKDSRGFCYYVDANGQPTYDPSVAC